VCACVYVCVHVCVRVPVMRLSVDKFCLSCARDAAHGKDQRLSCACDVAHGKAQHLPCAVDPAHDNFFSSSVYSRDGKK
jgi:hypothetical protein